MNIIADTNVLLRVVVADDVRQSRAAILAMEQADAVAISQHALCELVWVLDRHYGVSLSNIAATIRQLCDTRNVVVDRPTVEAGLATMEVGADFADGVIAYEGAWLGGETFVSFDKKAVAAVAKRGQKAKLLA
jgi:predicted nucleic-acid-binding protein